MDRFGSMDERYKKLKEALQNDLVEYYTEVQSTMPLSPLCPYRDGELEKFYAQPKMTYVQVRKKVANLKEFKGKEILTYRDVFEISEDTKNIYIQGNPGTGKTTYCKKLTLDWCRCYAAGKDNQTIQDRKKTIGINFDFLFLISLREGNDQFCDVFQMVKVTVLKIFSFQQKYDDTFLAKILDNERCLIILNGLDQWTHPESGPCYKSHKNIPHRAVVGKCVYLTLTRPWKLSQIYLKDSEIDVLIEIDGVKDPDELITNVINTLNSSKRKSKDAFTFMSDTRHLSSLIKVPIIAMQLVCMWYEDEIIPESQCSMFCGLLKMMFERNGVDNMSCEHSLEAEMPNCFHSKNWSELEKCILIQLGRLAFETLFPNDGHSSQVMITDGKANNYLEDEVKKTALFAGLITEYKIRSLYRERSQLSFLHKAFQEFLAIFYLSMNEDLVARVKIQEENIAEFSQLFFFICGMVPTQATAFSKNLVASTAKTSKKVKEDITMHITETMNNGYRECVQNGHGDVCLEMNHIYFGEDYKGRIYEPNKGLLRHNANKIETIWCTEETFYQNVLDILKACSKTITCLYLPKFDESLDLTMCSSLEVLRVHTPAHYRPDACLDMLGFENLEYLDIRQRRIAGNLNLNPQHECRPLNGKSQGEIVQKNGNKKLRHLSFDWCRFPRKDGGQRRHFHLDLTSCRSLEKLRVRWCDVEALSISSTNLKKCELYNIDLSQGNLLETLHKLRHSTELPRLERLELRYCRFAETDGIDNSEVSMEENPLFCIDMSACVNMTYIAIYYCDVTVKYDGLIIGKDTNEWKRRHNDVQ